MISFIYIYIVVHGDIFCDDAFYELFVKKTFCVNFFSFRIFCCAFSLEKKAIRIREYQLSYVDMGKLIKLIGYVMS